MGAATPPLPLSNPSADDLLALARSLAKAAAEVLRGRPPRLDVTTKTSPTDVVTEMDRAAEKVVLDGLARHRRGDAVVSEESPPTPGTSGITWYVDPLDGTVNYLYGLPDYAVSIAAEVSGEVVAGIVLDVERRTEFTATRGGGAWRDGERIRCSSTVELGQALVATGFHYTAELRSGQARQVAALLPQVRDIRRRGSAALDLCHVAYGGVDAFYEAGMHPWDWAAGALIAREAGARVSGLGGAPPGIHTTLAANPALFDLLHDVLVRSDPLGPSPQH